ncbi:hypothetical protein DIPPA_09371 [Diplonema papillatum]|nr:hypothetical protein DIPPA_09371 [Diplonema papillatum]
MPAGSPSLGFDAPPTASSSSGAGSSSILSTPRRLGDFLLPPAAFDYREETPALSRGVSPSSRRPARRCSRTARRSSWSVLFGARRFMASGTFGCRAAQSFLRASSS